LAMERAGDTSGQSIRDNLRAVASPGGEKIYYGEWAKAVALLRAGKEINYEGTSGVVDFKDNGDVAGGITIWKINKCQVVPVLTVSG